MKSASASVPIQPASMLAAELHDAVPHDAGDGDPDRPPTTGEVGQQLGEHVRHGVRGRRLRGVDPDPLGAEVAELEVDRARP